MRPQVLFPLFGPISGLKGVGDRVAPLLVKVAGPLVRDVVFTPPANVVVRQTTTAAHIVEDAVQTLTVTIEAHLKPARSGQPWKIRAFDDTGFVHLVFFKGIGAHLEPVSYTHLTLPTKRIV